MNGSRIFGVQRIKEKKLRGDINGNAFSMVGEVEPSIQFDSKLIGRTSNAERKYLKYICIESMYRKKVPYFPMIKLSQKYLPDAYN